MHSSHGKSWSFSPLTEETVMSFRGVFQTSIPRVNKESRAAGLLIPAFLFFPKLDPHESHLQVRIAVVSEHRFLLRDLKSCGPAHVVTMTSIKVQMIRIWLDHLASSPLWEGTQLHVAQKLDLAFASSPISQWCWALIFPLYFPVGGGCDLFYPEKCMPAKIKALRCCNSRISVRQILWCVIGSESHHHSKYAEFSTLFKHTIYLGNL